FYFPRHEGRRGAERHVGRAFSRTLLNGTFLVIDALHLSEDSHVRGYLRSQRGREGMNRSTVTRRFATLVSTITVAVLLCSARPGPAMAVANPDFDAVTFEPL